MFLNVLEHQKCEVVSAFCRIFCAKNASVIFIVSISISKNQYFEVQISYWNKLE